MNPTRVLASALLCGLGSILSAATATLSCDTALQATVPYGGGPVTFTALVYDYSIPAPVRWAVTIPTGWSYVSTSADGPPSAPPSGSTGTLQWTYTTLPTSPASFTFILNAPAGATSIQEFTSTVYLKNGDTESSITTPTVMLVQPGIPWATTGVATVGRTTATTAGSVDSARGAAVTSRGVIYSTAADPTLDSGTLITVGTGIGSFTASLSNLAPHTTYYYRAFATNALGTAYANVASFTTNAALVAPTVTSPTSTFDPTPTLSGKADPGVTVTIVIAGSPSGSTTADAGGNWSYTVGTELTTGIHTVTITSSDATGNTNSATLPLTVQVPSFNTPRPDGYAVSASGGGSTSTITVFTAAEFIAQATSANSGVITVVGLLDIGTVAVASNKTIQGADSAATIAGCLRLDSASNIVIRGLNFANPNGGCLQLSNATNVFITHCTFLDCAGDQLALQGNTDNVTVSWCEFAATRPGQASVRIGDGSTTPARHLMHVTLHHNWWARNLAGALPHINVGFVHQYDDYFTSAGNVLGTVAGASAQLLSERNVYSNTNSPLTKHGSGTGTIRANENIYASWTGTAPDNGSDTVFTPNYSYEMLATAHVATTVSALAGNTNGADTPVVATDSASITGPASDLATGASATLTAIASGFTGITYQWRLNNSPIPGATGATYTITSMGSTNLGTYTVVIGLADGTAVVSTPFNVGLEGTPFPGTVIVAGPAAPVSPGSNTTLNATAGGFTPISYQWFHAGNMINGATAATYTISNMNSTQTGSYAVSVSMPDGYLVRSPNFQVSLAESTQPGSGTSSTPTSPNPGGQTGTGGSSSSGSSSGSGGGGAISSWFLALLASLAAIRHKGRYSR